MTRIAINLNDQALEVLAHVAQQEHRSMQAQAAWLLETLLLRSVEPEAIPRTGEAGLSYVVARMTEAINSVTAELECTTDRTTYLRVPRNWVKALRVRWGEMLERLP